MVENVAELIVHARHDRPQDYHLCKDENLCLSILGLVHKSGNLVLFSALKIVYNTLALFCR